MAAVCICPPAQTWGSGGDLHQTCRACFPKPAEPWTGHRDLCSSQWSDHCDCLDEPVTEPTKEED